MQLPGLLFLFNCSPSRFLLPTFPSQAPQESKAPQHSEEVSTTNTPGLFGVHLSQVSYAKENIPQLAFQGTCYIVRMDHHSSFTTSDLGAEVTQAIAEAFPSHDPLDRPGFDATDYINTQFPSEQAALESLQPFLEKMTSDIGKLDYCL